MDLARKADVFAAGLRDHHPARAADLGRSPGECAVDIQSPPFTKSVPELPTVPLSTNVESALISTVESGTDVSAVKCVGAATDSFDQGVAAGSLQLAARDRGIVEINLRTRTRRQDQAGRGVRDRAFDHDFGVGADRFNGLRIVDIAVDVESAA